MDHDDDSFQDLIAKVRARDDQAAAELVRRYEPQVRRVIRVRLSPLLRKQMDSVDISQSILAEFFVRAAGGQFDLPSPENLVKLLSTMAYNKLTNRYQQAAAQRRDARKEQDVEDLPLAGNEPTPSRIVEGRELLEAMRQRLSEEERYLADQRARDAPGKSLRRT